MPPRTISEQLEAITGPESLEIRDTSATCSLVFRRTHGGPGTVETKFAGGRVGVDVSLQPSVVRRQLETYALEHGVDPNRWSVAALRALVEWEPARLSWCTTDSATSLDKAVSAFTHPLLTELYRLGAAAVDEVPRWSAPLLRSPDPKAAALLLDARATRRMVRALASSFLGDPALVAGTAPGESGQAAVRLQPLAFAVAGAGLVAADQLANILETSGCDHDATLPDPAEIRTVRAELQQWPEERRARLLVDSCRTGDFKAVAAVMTHFSWVRHKVPRPLPVRLTELRSVTRGLVDIVTEPEPQPTQATAELPHEEAQPPTRTPATRQRRNLRTIAQATREHHPGQIADPVAALVEAFGATVERERTPRYRALAPPPRTSAAAPPTRWPIPPELLPVHQAERDGIRLVVPTSAAELRQWGHILSNCVADYAQAMASGNAWLVGVERDRLIGCAEITPARRRIRQLLGRRNAQLPERDVHTVLELLLEHHVVL